MGKIRLPHELFAHRLRTMLFVEETLDREILPLLSEHVHATDLEYGIERHRLETAHHVRTVRGILHLLGADAEPEPSALLLGLKAEHDALVAAIDTSRPEIVDLAHAGLIARTEHLEIAAYTELRSHANALGEEDVAIRLQEILEQEQYALELAEKALAKALAEHVES